MLKVFNKYKDLVIILTIIIGIIFFTIIVSYTFAYFKNNKTTSGEIVLGELDYQINVQNVSQDLLLPGDIRDLSVKIENKVAGKNNLVPFYFRFKILDEGKNYNSNFIILTNEDDFIFGNDFYYYKYKLNYKDSLEIIKQIVIDKKLTFEEAKVLNLQILVDAVQSEFGAYLDVFYDAPSEWFQFVENN